METKRRSKILILICFFIVGLLIACQNDENYSDKIQEEDNHKQDEEIEVIGEGEEKKIKITMWAGLQLDQSEFELTYQNPLQEKFPHLEIQLLPTDLLDDESYSTFVKHHLTKKPDIILADEGIINELLQLNVEYDLYDLMSKYNLDIQSFDSRKIDNILLADDQERFLALPYSRNAYALFYNKTLFDQLQLSYPNDDMSWEEVFVLAEQVESRLNDEQIISLDIERMTHSQLGLQLVDPKSNKINFTSHALWIDWLRYYLQYIHIINDREILNSPSIINFMEGKAAMATGSLNGGFRYFVNGDATIFASEGEMDWDMVAIPYFVEAPGIAPYSSTIVLAIHPSSDYVEEAFQIISFMSSEEWQLSIAQEGVVPILSQSSAIYDGFGEYLPTFGEKNISALFKRRPAVIKYSPYESLISLTAYERFQEWKLDDDILAELDKLENDLNEMLQIHLKSE